MSETSLKFGPEWLRALSHGGAVSSPPTSPSPSKIKVQLAENRFSREEMLAIYHQCTFSPEYINELGPLSVSDPQTPLALLPFTTEEQRLWQRFMNSEGGLRGTGRAAVNGTGRLRGASVERGRGRGRGVGVPYYSRGISFDEESEGRGPRESGPPGMRSKGYERSQSLGEGRVWGERGSVDRPSAGERGLLSGPLEDRIGAISPKKEPGRSSNENWRSRDREEEGQDRWRGLSSSRGDKWGTKSGWREKENSLEEWEDGMERMSSARLPKTPWDGDRDSRRHWEEDSLPEWATESTDEKGGSFDATGAFHAPGSSEDEEENEKPPGNAHMEEVSRHICDNNNSKLMHDESKHMTIVSQQNVTLQNSRDRSGDTKPKSLNARLVPQEIDDFQPSSVMNGTISEGDEEELSQSNVVLPSHQPLSGLDHELSNQGPDLNSRVDGTSVNTEESQGEEEKMEHMKNVADDLVAKLVEEDEPKPKLHRPPPGGFLPHADHPPQTQPEDQWYYRDPQGEIQGPFLSSEMEVWYKAGYFMPDLLLRRQCDDKFAQLGDLTRVFGRVPFSPGPLVPPFKVSELISAQKAQAERERYELLQTLMLQKQFYHPQLNLRQQQVLQQLQSMEGWSSLTTQQQHNLCLTQLMSLPPLVTSNFPPSLAVSSGLSPSPNTTGPLPGGGGIPIPATTSNLQHDIHVGLPSSAPSLPKVQQDPIQAFLVRMNPPHQFPVGKCTDSIIPGLQVPPSVCAPPTVQNASMTTENPLQQLLAQLQRASGSQLQPSSDNAPLVSAPSSAYVPCLPTEAPLHTEKVPVQFDAIQSLMNQLAQIQTPTSLQDGREPVHMHGGRGVDKDQGDPGLLQREENQGPEITQDIISRETVITSVQEEKNKLEEKHMLEEIQQNNQDCLGVERGGLAEEPRHQENQAKKPEEREPVKKKQEHQPKAEMKKKDEDLKKHGSKSKQKAQLQEEAERQEEAKRQAEEKRKEEEKRRKEAERKRLEDEKRKEEERQKREEKQKAEEERKRNEEKERQERLKQEELRCLALEEERRRMKEIEEEERRLAKEEDEKILNMLQQEITQTQQVMLKNTQSAWNQPQSSLTETSPVPSLLEIQRIQEQKEKEREAEMQREMQKQREQQRRESEEKRPRDSNLKWASKSNQSFKGLNDQVNGNNPPVKSLLEIQAEEEKEQKKKMVKEQAERAAAVSNLNLSTAGVWGYASQTLFWANKTSGGTPQAWASGKSSNQTPMQNSWLGTSQGSNGPIVTHKQSDTTVSVWSHSSSHTTGGFWENPESSRGSKGAASSTNRSPPKNNASISQSSKAQAIQTVQNNRTKKKAKDESEAVKKLFTENMSSGDMFTQWCKSSLTAMKVHASIDIPTFVGFLAEVDSPYEVHDYIRSYLGDSKEVKEFAKQYLERRSKAKNSKKENQMEDNILAPAPAITPSSGNEFQEVKCRMKKGKKKMQKVDSSILGFSVTSSERMNVGERETVE